MLPVQISTIDPAEYSRCKDQTTIARQEQDPAPISKVDAAMREHIYQALWKDDVLRAVEYHEIDVHVKDGVIYLYGHIVSVTSQGRIINAMRAIPGILRIENNLVLDDTLSLKIATALGELEHAYDCKFFTGSSHGVVSINGIVRDDHVKMLAEKCAGSNPNVRGVINNVQVSGTELGLHNQPFLQPVMGALIYFLDGISGVVKQVVINPNNRRVIEMIIHGQFPGHKQNLTALQNNQGHMPVETIVIPVNLIRYLTDISGFLTIKSTETTQYRDFNPLYFTNPRIEWTPPYPYCPGDVLFNVGAEEIENQKMVDPDIEQLNISAQPTSAKASEMPVDIIATWEDDGGQIIQPAEAVAVAEPGISTSETQSSIQTEKSITHVNDSPGG